MSTIELRRELKQLIELEQDVNILETIKSFLKSPGTKNILKEKLTSRALKSEEDIKNGYLYSRSDIKLKTDDFLNQ